MTATTTPMVARLTAKLLLRELLALPHFHPMGDKPAAIPYVQSDGVTPLVVMVGDNASGKSFARRLVTTLCQERKVECIHLSMEGRRKVAYSPWLSLVYGDESRKSTGQNSVSTVLGAIRTAHDRSTDNVIFWDEPDLGLSEDWSSSVGQTICDFANKMPSFTRAAFVVTHSKSLVTQLRAAEPHYVYFGDDKDPPRTLDAWLARTPLHRQNPQSLIDLSMERFRRIQHVERQLGKDKP